jgi:hypothetical protein
MIIFIKINKQYNKFVNYFKIYKKKLKIKKSKIKIAEVILNLIFRVVSL